MKRIVSVFAMLVLSQYTHANETPVPAEIQSIIAQNLPERQIFDACALPSEDKSHPHWFVGIASSEVKQKAANLVNDSLAIERIGVVWVNGQYHFQNVDATLSQDKKNANPQTWVATRPSAETNDKSFVMKCGLNTKNKKNLSFKDFKPYFSLASLHLTQKDVVCHTTSDVYGNWDCMIFHPKNKRFVYWFQQLYAD